MDRGSWAGLPYQNLLFICELLSQPIFLLSSSGKSLTSIRIDTFIQRENYRRALLLYFVPRGEILWLIYGKSSVYVRGSSVHVRAL